MATTKSENYFKQLNAINCNDKTEKKNGLTYLSWAWAWAEVKKLHPDAFYTIYENADGWFYHTDGRTCWVKTGVTINGLEHIEYLPVMDFRNASIPADKVTSFDVNKAIQRSLTKACARHGLGLYIYAGEDLPEEAPAETQPAAPKAAAKREQQQPEPQMVGKLTLRQTYNVIAAVAEGRRTKTGGDMRQAWIETAQPNDEQIAWFDEQVKCYKQSTTANQ